LFELDRLELSAEYPLSHFSSAPSALGSVMSDSRPDNGLNNRINLQTAKLASKHIKVHEFAFVDSTPPPLTQDPGVEMGTVHSAELHYEFPHFFNTKRLDGPHLTAGV
jgi:para-nitrobenzyl esterase